MKSKEKKKREIKVKSKGGAEGAEDGQVNEGRKKRTLRQHEERE